MRCWLIHCSITPRQERLRLGTDRVWFYSNETPPGLQAMPDGAGTVFDAWGRHNKQDTIFINKAIIGTFWRPGNLNLALRRASITDAWWFSRARTDMMGCPMCTRATVPCGLPKAPLIPVWSLQNKQVW